MEQAYKNKALTDKEVFSLVAFLQHADRESAFQPPQDYGMRLFIAGLIGTAILLLLYSIIWRNRKKGSVNQAIYDRQINSTLE
jgi:hypothetical protein